MSNRKFLPGDYLGMVQEFHDAFDASKDPMLWIKLIREETEELQESMVEGDRLNALKEAADVAYVTAGFVLASVYVDAEYVDAADVDTANGVISAAQDVADDYRKWDRLVTDDILREAFCRVHESNMSKLGDDGKPIRREDGKVLKGPHYRKPDLMDLITG